MLKPTMRSGWPLNRFETLPITPGVSILQSQGEQCTERRKKLQCMYVRIHTNNVHKQEISPLKSVAICVGQKAPG